MKITQELTLDTSRENLFRTVHAKQYDEDSRFLKITITTQGEEVVVEEGSTVVLSVKRADSSSGNFDGYVNEDGTVTIPLPDWMLLKDGKHTCSVSIIKGEEKLSTLNFIVYAEKAPAYASDLTDEDHDKIDALIIRVEEIEGQIKNINSAEKNAVSSAQEATHAAETAATAATTAHSLATSAKYYATQAENYSNELADTIEEIEDARGEYDSINERMNAMHSEIEGGVPKDIKVQTDENGNEKLVLVDGEGNQLGEGKDLTDYVKNTDLDYATMKALTNPKNHKWEEGEQEAARATLNAAPKVSPITTVNQVWISNSAGGTWRTIQSNTASGAKENVAIYLGNTDGTTKPTGYLVSNTPTKPYHVANMKYVDDARLYKHTYTIGLPFYNEIGGFEGYYIDTKFWVLSFYSKSKEPMYMDSIFERFEKGVYFDVLPQEKHPIIGSYDNDFIYKIKYVDGNNQIIETTFAEYNMETNELVWLVGIASYVIE